MLLCFVALIPFFFSAKLPFPCRQNKLIRDFLEIFTQFYCGCTQSSCEFVDCFHLEAKYTFIHIFIYVFAVQINLYRETSFSSRHYKLILKTISHMNRFYGIELNANISHLIGCIILHVLGP